MRTNVAETSFEAFHAHHASSAQCWLHAKELVAAQKRKDRCSGVTVLPVKLAAKQRELIA